MKHNTLTKIITLALAAVLALSLAACGSKTNDDSGDKTDAPVIKIGVPNDTTNEARALLLLQENGIIKLKDGVGITATKNDIVENPYNVEIVEAEAARLPDMLKDADYAVINSNYAINAGLNPVNDSLAIEGSSSAYANILAVKEGTETAPKILALKAALESYETSIKGLFSMSAEEREAFTVIGSINGDGWSVDLPMTKQDDGSWLTDEAYKMDAGVEFKVRQGKAWDVAYGTDGNNFVVETAGTYKVRLTLNGEEGTVELVPAE